MFRDNLLAISQSTFKIDAAQPPLATEISPMLVFLCCTIRYGFRAGATAFSCSVDMA